MARGGPRASSIGSCLTTGGAAPDARDTGGVGFDPQRRHVRTPLDYALVAAALAICLGLVVWAIVG